MYSKNAFSNNRIDTITTLNPVYQNVIGLIDRMSADDSRRIRNMYECYKYNINNYQLGLNFFR